MEKQQTKDPEAANLRRLIRVFTHRWVLIVGCALALGTFSLALSLSKTSLYAASSTLLFRSDNLDQQLFGGTILKASNDPVREGSTNLGLASLGAVSAETAKAMGRGMTAGHVAGAVSVSAKGESDLVLVTATDPDPVLAAEIANAYALQFVQFRINADRSKVQQAVTLVENQLKVAGSAASTQSAELVQQLDRLRLFEALQTGNAEVVQKASPPSSPSSPTPIRDAALGLFVGFILGLLSALVLDRLDRRLTDVAMIEEDLGLSVLAVVPKSEKLAQEREVGIQAKAELEVFRMLRARMRYFNVDRDIRTVVVGSSAAGDGKSTVSLHLCLAAASAAGVRVLLIEADMRRPTIASKASVGTGLGLSELITQQNLEMADVIVEVPFSIGKKDEAEKVSFDLIPAGAEPPNPFDLIASARMTAIIADARERYDLVVIDTPPVSVVSDSMPLMQQVDGVIVVARLGHTTRDGLKRLTSTMEDMTAPLLGIVVNGLEASERGYGYGYGYGSGGYFDEPKVDADDASEDSAPVVEESRS